MLSYIESLNYPTSRGKIEEYDFRKRWHENIYMVNEQNKMIYPIELKNLVSTIFAMKLDSFILHQIDRLSVNKCHVWDITTSLVKNWRLSLFLIYLSLSIRSYLPTETWVPRTTMKQNFLFLYRWMGTRKIPKSSTAYSLIFMSYELSVVNTVFRSKRGGLWKQGLSTQVYEQDLRGPGIGQDVMLAVILGKRENCTVIRGHFHWVEITWQGGHVVRQTIQIFSGIYTKKNKV